MCLALDEHSPHVPVCEVLGVVQKTQVEFADLALVSFRSPLKHKYVGLHSVLSYHLDELGKQWQRFQQSRNHTCFGAGHKFGALSSYCVGGVVSILNMPQCCLRMLFTRKSKKQSATRTQHVPCNGRHTCKSQFDTSDNWPALG